MASSQAPAANAASAPKAQAAYGQRAGLPRHLQNILSLHDFEAAARKHLPRPLFGYVSGAAEDCVSLQANRDSFQQYGFSSKVMVDVSRRNQKVELFGQTWDSPFGVAPVGISAISAYRGDLVLAQTAAANRIPAIMSGTSLIPMEEVAKAARLSSNQISQIEKIQKAASPELVEAVRSGTISINAAATVASRAMACGS